MRQRLEAEIRQQVEQENAQWRSAESARLERQFQHYVYIGADKALVRQIKALLHPDKVQHPEAKKQLHEAFTAFETATKPRVKSAQDHAKREEERRKQRQEVRERNSRRSKEAWARRKAKDERA